MAVSSDMCRCVPKTKQTASQQEEQIGLGTTVFSYVVFSFFLFFCQRPEPLSNEIHRPKECLPLTLPVTHSQSISAELVL